MGPVIDMAALCGDLAAEHAALDAIVAGLDEARWAAPTPAEGWAVRDHIAHLAYSDVAAYLAAPDRFETVRANGYASCYIRPLVWRGVESLGLDPRPCPVEASIIVWEWSAMFGADGLEKGIDVEYCTIGNKGLGFVNRMGGRIVSQVVNYGDHPSL